MLILKNRQVKIDPEDRKKTTFTAAEGYDSLKQKLFALCSSPAIFEMLMEEILL